MLENILLDIESLVDAGEYFVGSYNDIIEGRRIFCWLSFCH